jgi:hypothetical protein
MATGNRHLIAKFDAAMPPRRLFVAPGSAHITVIAAAADLRRWGAVSPFIITREE